MTYADENLQEQETVNESTPSPNVKSDSSEDVAQHFICIKEVRPVSRAKALRLKTGDVIVGIESKTFLGSVEDLLDIFDEINEEEGALLTIWRAGVSFNLIIFGPLGCVFEFTSDEVTNAVHTAIPDIKMDDIKEYTTFELLRNIEGECNIFDTRVSQLGIYLPPVWLIQQRLWEPLFAIMSVYIVTLIVHWVLFLIAGVLLAIYFRRAQLILLRSFSLYKGKIIWMIIAEKTMLDAQKIARLFDPNITFKPDLVGPPAPVELNPEKKKKKKKRKSSIPTQ